MFIEQPSKWLRWLYPQALWRMDATDHSVYLTFDDGPIPESTPHILKILRDFDIKATFFVVGDNVRKYPELFQQIVADGHRIGNHTFNHWGARHSGKQYRDNIERCQAIIETMSNDTATATASEAQAKATEDKKPLFRPPHGWMRLPFYHMVNKKYRIVMWDLVTRDYSHLLSPYDIVRNVHRYARNGSIITFHDSLKSIDKLYFALPASLRWLKSQGYSFKVFD